MTETGRRRQARTALVLVPTLLFALAACGSGTISADDVANKAESALAEKVGQRPDITCPDDLEAKKGESETCTLTDPNSGTEYDMTATVSSVEGDTYHLDFQVAQQPKS